MKSYHEMVKEDVKAVIAEYVKNVKNGDEMDDAEEIYDLMWSDDRVTGNGSGSYHGDKDKAKATVLANIDEVVKAFVGFESKDLLTEWLADGYYETIDVYARCYTLSGALSEVLAEKKGGTQMTNNKTIPATYGEAKAMGYVDKDYRLFAGYVSRKVKADDQPVMVAGGTRKGELYVELPNRKSTRFSYRQYIGLPKTC